MNKAYLKEAVLSFIFPKRCRFCDSVMDFRRIECKKCADEIEKIVGEVCLLCGYMKKDCFCKGHKHYYKAIVAPFYYEGAAGKAIRRIKRLNDEKTVKMFSEEMSRTFDEYLGYLSYDYVTSVPLSDLALTKRGYNQAELLARELALRLSLPYIETLSKTNETKMQHTLTKTERTGNLLGIFEPFIGDILEDKRIILVDDVKTTGATLDECVKTLMIAGAQEVVCVCAAITKHENKN